MPTLPLAVEEVVMTALAKDSHSRFTNVAAFANALEQACRPVPLACPTTIFERPAPQSETSNAGLPLNKPPEQPPIMSRPFSDLIQSQSISLSPSILAQVPDKIASSEGAVELQDSIDIEAGITGEGNRHADASPSPLSEAFDYFPTHNPPMHPGAKSYKVKSTTPEADLRSDVVEPLSAHPKNIDYVPATGTVPLWVAEPEAYATMDVDPSSNGEQSAHYHRKRGRIWLFSLLIITVVVLIAGFVPSLATTTTVTIPPDSTVETNT